MTVRPPSGFPLPELVLVANRVLTEEAQALRAALEGFSNAPQPGCPWTQDDRTVAELSGSEAQGRAKLLLYARHQAGLIYVNAYDHLLTLARNLGGDGAMPLFSHASLSRVVCEAAVRLAWLMDPEVSSEVRIVRGAAALYESALERLKGVRRLAGGHFDRRMLQMLLDNCADERDEVETVIADAGLVFGYSEKGKTKVRLELDSAEASVSLKLNISELMATLLPDSPSSYNIGSSVTHSLYWGLRDVNDSRPGEPMTLTPQVLDVGGAVEAAISASALILDRCGRCYGHDPVAYVRLSKERREAIDQLMLRATRSRWARVPTELTRPSSSG